MGSNEECNARRQAAAPTRTPRAIGCGGGVICDSRLPSLRKRAASLSNTAPAARRQVVAVLLAPRLSTRVLLITYLDAGAACATFNCRSLACRCRRCTRRSYLPSPSCFGCIIAPAAPSLALTRSPAPAPAFTHALPSTSLFHPTAATIQSRCLTYPQSSAVDLPLSVRQVLHLRHGVPPILPSCQKAPTRHSSACPLAVNSRTVFTSLTLPESTIPQSQPHHYGSVNVAIAASVTPYNTAGLHSPAERILTFNTPKKKTSWVAAVEIAKKASRSQRTRSGPTLCVPQIATATWRTLTVTEPLGFQVQLLPHALLLRLAVDSRHHLLRSLLRRRLYRRQSARLQQMVEPSEAKGAL
jgi:hypothetical protein